VFVIISRSAEGYEFRGFVPSCFDPTYCETNPPIPFYENANYKIPPIGTLKFNDGEVVTYTCQNSSIFWLFRYFFDYYYLPIFSWFLISFALHQVYYLHSTHNFLVVSHLTYDSHSCY